MLSYIAHTKGVFGFFLKAWHPCCVKIHLSSKHWGKCVHISTARNRLQKGEESSQDIKILTHASHIAAIDVKKRRMKVLYPTQQMMNENTDFAGMTKKTSNQKTSSWALYPPAKSQTDFTSTWRFRHMSPKRLTDPVPNLQLVSVKDNTVLWEMPWFYHQITVQCTCLLVSSIFYSTNLSIGARYKWQPIILLHVSSPLCISP